MWLGDLVRLDSESELVSSDVLSNVKNSLGSHSSSDLEGNSISLWVSLVFHTSSVNVPGLVESIVAVPEDAVSEVSV